MIAKHMDLVLGLRRIHLPVIQEEEGGMNEDKAELANINFKKEYQGRKTLKIITSNNSPEIARKQSKAPPVKLPPLLNVNHSKKSDIKQATTAGKNIGKQSIKRKTYVESKISAKIKENHSLNLKSLKKNSGNYENGQSLRPMRPTANKISVHVPSMKSGGKNYDSASLGGQNSPEKKKKTKVTNKKNQNIVKKENMNKKLVTKTNVETKSKERTSKYENVDSLTEKIMASREPLTTPFFRKNEAFLTDCMKSVLEKNMDNIICDHCQEKFTNIEKFLTHKKKHEKEKEVCLLCEKVFFNSKDFINHLLTHDGIDRFNCETCGRNFLNGEKYRNHCKEFHLLYSGNTVLEQHSSQNLELAKNLIPKYECED